ncbi:hypothetical protein AAF712_005929 [Marasmius tenuissimus]|uniref:AB hydrolase-1 domain-containing protein n=1 Tax=Marasmius tenuissimus TaxID=585030 RepID=A0ABR3A032_9AGAR
MLGKTLPEYIFILISIAILNLIGPASLVYVTWYSYHYLYRGNLEGRVNFIISTGIFAYAILEVLFLLGVYWPRKRRLVKEAIYDAPEQLTRTEREVLFTKCSSVIFPPSGNYPTGWFTIPNQDSVRLRKQNVVEWLLWALFACEVEHALSDEWKEEIEGYVRRIEERLGYKLEEGHEASAKSMRLTFDELKANYRPLVWYITIGIVDSMTALRLFLLGFKHYTPKHSNFFMNAFSIFPFRGFDIFSNSSSTPYFPYWCRPHKSATKDPIVFIHGIGIGVYPYVPLIATLTREDPDVGILVVELLPISNRILMPYVGSAHKSFPIPTRQTMLDAVYATMRSLGAPWAKAALATHSYGTVIAAYDIRERAKTRRQYPYHDEADSETIASPPIPQFTSYLLVDPIPFLLNLPSVAHNFMYRSPWRRRSDDPHSITSTYTSLWSRLWTGYNGNEWQLWYFASRDLEVAFTLSRRFFWDDVVLWREDLGLELSQDTDHVHDPSSGGGRASPGPSPPVAVVLSGDDQIVPASNVRDYLVGENPELWEKFEMGCHTHYANLSPSKRLEHSAALEEILYYPGLDHATVFDTRQRRQGLVEVIERFCSRRTIQA